MKRSRNRDEEVRTTGKIKRKESLIYITRIVKGPR